MTFTILTAADQNNTYLFMHDSRKHVCSEQVYIPGKKDRHHPGIMTLSFWAMCNHLRVACCNSIALVSYNMLNSLERGKTLNADY